MDAPLCAETIKFHDILLSADLVQHVVGPTHYVSQESQGSGHTLDVVITHRTSTVSVSVDQPVISDHSVITAELSCSRDVCCLSSTSTTYRRRWSDFDADVFERDLRAVLASDLACNPPSDCDSLFKCYDVIMRRLIDQHAPLIPSASRRARDSPGFDHSCRRAKAITRRCEKIFRKTRTSESYENWRAMFESQRCIFQTAYSRYWQATINKCTDSKTLWQKLNGLLQPLAGPQPSHTAEQFASFFNAKIESIREASVDAPPPIIRPRVTQPFSSFTPTSADEMAKLIMKAPNKQCSLDPVPTWLVKKFHHILAPVLSHLVNASLSQGIFHVITSLLWSIP